MTKNKKGLIIIYYGNGKGKTTAAVGLAVRAAGAGKKVLFAQFVKAAKVTGPGEWPVSSEIHSLKKLSKVSVKILGRGFVGILGDRKKHAEHVTAAKQGLSWLRQQIEKGRYDVVIADELISAIEVKVLTMFDVKKVLLDAKKKGIVIAATGHNYFPTLISAANLVSEMKMIKHPYYQGIQAMRGIDF